MKKELKFTWSTRRKERFNFVMEWTKKKTKKKKNNFGQHATKLISQDTKKKEKNSFSLKLLVTCQSEYYSLTKRTHVTHLHTHRCYSLAHMLLTCTRTHYSLAHVTHSHMHTRYSLAHTHITHLNTHICYALAHTLLTCSRTHVTH